MPGLRWTIGPNEHTFAILEGPLEFQMGAPAGKGEFYGSPVLHYRKIDRSIAVGHEGGFSQAIPAISSGTPERSAIWRRAGLRCDPYFLVCSSRVLQLAEQGSQDSQERVVLSGERSDRAWFSRRMR